MVEDPLPARRLPILRRHTPVGDSRPAGCASNRPAPSKNPAGPSTFAANRYGQQLFFANMRFQRPRTPRLEPPSASSDVQASAFRPLTWRQEPSSTMDPTRPWSRRMRAADSDLIRLLQRVVRDHAARHGWSKRQTNDVIRSLRLLQVLQDTPGAKIHASEVPQLPRYDGNINSTLDVLAAAGMLIDDRVSHVERYFAAKTAGLPEPMRAQLEIWLEVMLNGAPPHRGNAPGTPRPPASTSWGSPRSSTPGPTQGTNPWPRSPPKRCAPRCPKRVPAQLGRVTDSGPCSRCSRPAS